MFRGLEADFLAVDFSKRSGNLLVTWKNVALNLNRMLRVTNILVCKIQSARGVLLSGSQPQENCF